MKKCKSEGCNNPAFSHLYCRYHQHLRTDEKWVSKKTTSVSPQTRQARKELHEKDMEFYMSLWDKRLHVCSMCDDLIPFFSFNFFHHILEKGRRLYKHLRHEPDNVIIVCQSCHDKFHYANPPAVMKKVIIFTYSLFKTRGMLP